MSPMGNQRSTRFLFAEYAIAGYNRVNLSDGESSPCSRSCQLY
jgi:hypothetical protein